MQIYCCHDHIMVFVVDPKSKSECSHAAGFMQQVFPLTLGQTFIGLQQTLKLSDN